VTFLNYAVYQFSAQMWFFNANVCNRGVKEEELKEEEQK